MKQNPLNMMPNNDGTVVAPGCPMDLLDVDAPSLLVKTVDVLCDDAGQLAVLLPLCQDAMRRVWLHGACVQMTTVVVEEHIRLIPQAFIGKKVLRLVTGEALFGFMIQAILASEIGDAALRGYARPAEENRGGGVSEHHAEGGKLLFFRHAVEWVFHCFALHASCAAM